MYTILNSMSYTKTKIIIFKIINNKKNNNLTAFFLILNMQEL